MEVIFDALGLIAHSVVQIGLNWILLGMAITAVIWMLLVPRVISSGSGRYIVWLATLGLLLIMPLRISLPPGDAGQSPATSQSDNTEFVGSVKANVAVEVPEEQMRSASVQIDVAAANRAIMHTDNFRKSAKASIGEVLISLTPVLLIFVWAIVCLLQLARISVGWMRLNRIKRNAKDLPWAVQTRAVQLSHRISLARLVRVAQSNEVNSPVAAGLTTPTILFPIGYYEKLSADEMDMILIHELVHLKRRDDWMRLIQSVVAAAAFFNPAIHWINRQLELEREIACDERVVSITRQRKKYARFLARLARLSGDVQQPALMQNVVLSKKQIYRRFEMLFSRESSKSTSSNIRKAAILVACLVFSVSIIQVAPVVALPETVMTYTEMADSIDSLIGSISSGQESAQTTLAEPTAASKDLSAPQNGNNDLVGESPSTQPDQADPILLASAGEDERHRRGIISRSANAISDLFGGTEHGFSSELTDDGESKVVWSDGNRKVQARMYGKIEFTDTEDDIKSISHEGYFEISERIGSSKHELEVEPGKDGELRYKYLRNGKKTDFDNEGKEWLAKLLPEIFRETGIGAEQRVARMLKVGGVDAVIDEMELINSDYVTRVYFGELVEQGNLDSSNLNRILKLAAESMKSDYEKAELAITIASFGIDDNGLVKPYVDLVKTLDSDYEIRRVLSELSMTDPIDNAVLADILDIASQMSSDYETAELLIEMAPPSRTDEKLRTAYVNAVRKIHSDYDKHRVLSALGTNYETDNALIVDLLQIASEMSSDYEKAELLIELSRKSGTDAQLYLAYLDAAATLDSDYDAKRVLTQIGAAHWEEAGIAEKIMEITARMDSDYEKAELMIEFSEALEGNPDALGTFLEVTKGIDSDYDASRVLEQFIAVPGLEQEHLVEVLRVIGTIGSDYEKGKLLQQLGRRCRGNDVLEEAFLDAVETMDSEYEQDRAYASLHKRRKAESY